MLEDQRSRPCDDRRVLVHYQPLARMEELFFVAMSSLLLEHPFANVWRAIHHLNSTRLALIEQSNSVQIDNVYLIQIQSHRLSGLFDFGTHFDEM